MQIKDKITFHESHFFFLHFKDKVKLPAADLNCLTMSVSFSLNQACKETFFCFFSCTLTRGVGSLYWWHAAACKTLIFTVTFNEIICSFFM